MTSDSPPSLHPGPLRQPLAFPVGDAAVVSASGRLDSTRFLALDRLVTGALDDGPRHVVLDLSEVDSIEPDALGCLWATLRGARRRGSALAVAGARPELQPTLEVLTSSGLPIYPSVGAALSAAHMPSASA